MRSRALALAAALVLVGGCGNHVSDPASARCDDPPVKLGRRIPLADHNEVPVRYRCVDAALSGTLYLPKHRGPHPALIWVHAAGEAPRLRWGAFTRSFVQAGIAVFSFDKRGVGESQGNCCPGDKGHFNLATADVVGAIAAVRRTREVDPARVGLFGASQAGWIAPRAAVESRHVAFVVLAAPGVVTFDQEHRYEQLTGGYGSSKPFPSEREIAKALGEPSGFDVVPYLRRMKVPTLWLLAGKDQEIPLTATVAILKRLSASGKDYIVKVYPRANHGLFDTPPTSRDALPDTLHWLLSRVGQPAT
jgi:hypothetical protein